MVAVTQSGGADPTSEASETTRGHAERFPGDFGLAHDGGDHLDARRRLETDDQRIQRGRLVGVQERHGLRQSHSCIMTVSFCRDRRCTNDDPRGVHVGVARSDGRARRAVAAARAVGVRQCVAVHGDGLPGVERLRARDPARVRASRPRRPRPSSTRTPARRRPARAPGRIPLRRRATIDADGSLWASAPPSRRKSPSSIAGAFAIAGGSTTRRALGAGRR